MVHDCVTSSSISFAVRSSFCVCASFNSFTAPAFSLFLFFQRMLLLRYNHGINIHEFRGSAPPQSSLFHVHVIFLSPVKREPVSLRLSISFFFPLFSVFLLISCHTSTLYTQLPRLPRGMVCGNWLTESVIVLVYFISALLYIVIASSFWGNSVGLDKGNSLESNKCSLLLDIWNSYISNLQC